MSWAAKRQLLYGTIVALFLLIVIGVPVYFIYFTAAPTCFDHKQDQNETGVDCGGVCALACADQVVAKPVVIWSQAFPVASGIYNLVAYVQNPNVSYVGTPTHYLFRVYDKDNVLIGVRDGYASIPPTKTFPIFEQGFDAGARIPVNTFFDFEDNVTWEKYPGTQAELNVTNERLIDVTSTPHIYATVVNNTINTYQNVEVIALVYDLNGNAIAASRTILDSLGSTASQDVVFTWPSAFMASTSKIEIIPKLPIDPTVK